MRGRENPIPPPDQGEVRWGLSDPIFGADYRGDAGCEDFFEQPVSTGYALPQLGSARLITNHRRRRRRGSTSYGSVTQGKHRVRRRYSLARLLIIAGIAFLAASVMLRRMLRPLRRPSFSHASRIALSTYSVPRTLGSVPLPLSCGRGEVRATDRSGEGAAEPV